MSTPHDAAPAYARDAFDRWEDSPTGDVRALDALADLRRYVDEMIVNEVTEARRLGLSWAGIAAGLGVTAQAAHQRFAPTASSTS